MAISSPGVGSNLDVNGIVSKLMQVESQPLTQLDKKEASYQAQLSAYGSLSGALGSFQSAVSGLSNLSKFQSFTATPGDSTVLTASASSSASAGSYAVNVTALAQAQTLVANGQSSNTTGLGNGATTLSFQFGTAGTSASFGVAQTVTIGANSSLQNIADAVNAANLGVSATIVNDGSATPFRLVFSAKNTGAANSMSVTTADPTLQGFLSYDQVSVGGVKNMTQTAAAQNAGLTVNGVAVSSTSNTVTGAITGVTLNLAKIGTTTLTVARDTATLQSAIEGLVKAYNDANKTITNLSSYNEATKQGGPLLGDSATRAIQSQIRRTLSSAIPGLNGNLTNLSQVGISFQKDGTLALDSAKLQNAISNNFGDLAGLFAAAGKTSDSLVSYLGSSSSTKPGSYDVNITQLSTQGNTVGNVNLNLASTTIASGTTMNVTLDGVSASVALTAGTYTSAQLATMVQSVINSTAAFSAAGSAVTATINGSGFLSVTSARHGSASNVSMTAGTGTSVAAFMGTATNSAGLDVAGSINGIPATGSGQTLTGATGSTTDGLKLQVTGGAVGARGTVNFSQGYAYQLNSVLSNFLSSPSLISSRTDGINRSIKDIQHQRDVMNTRLAATEARYRAQFTALDTLISSMTQTSNYLTQQLANLPKAS